MDRVTEMGMDSIIQLTSVSKIYGEGALAISALKNVSLAVEKGKVVTIMGPSGSGKSTMLNLLGAMDTPTTGDVIVDGINVARLPESKLAAFRRFSIGFVFQNYYLLPNLDVIDNVLVPLIPYGIKPDDRQRAQELLDVVGLGARVRSKVRELSGGQAQRVAIARALINNPNVVLADEPTGNLDSEMGKSVIDTLFKFCDRGKTIVIVTHDPRIGHAVADYPKGRNIWMQDGQISDKPTYDQFCWG